MMFENFDSSIGVEGYYKIIRSKFFPNEEPDSFNIAGFNAEEQIFRKGAVFSRVRKLSSNDVSRFFNGDISISDFYPPKSHIHEIRTGRFNSMDKSVLYVADHPYIAIQECEIKENDFFLLTFLSLNKDMCFLHIKENKGELSDLLFHLFKAKDKRFYPVINLVYDDLLSFDKYQGIAYDSVKVNAGYVHSLWGKINSVKNIAISNDYMNHVSLKASWLEHYCVDDSVLECAIFTPLSNKKKNKLNKIFCKVDKNKFINLSNEIKEEMQSNELRNKILLDKGNVSSFDKPPVLLVNKKPY
ncbi:RES domain-containing protein [Pectobacterium odoriferum]|uniref:RES domain-containing protein n=1 Tax=Pectobacterium odoriferum TaxID=78398 RepID=UPI000A974C37|nr:RES domain-containing protein [Pectobacterium odoriferum]